MRLFIIGGTNFIGPHVVEELHKNGHEIILFNRGKTSYVFPFEVTYLRGDRIDLVSFADRIKSLRPDVVIDMMAYTKNDAAQLVKTFRGLVKRVVVISSCDVYRAYDRLWNVLTDAYISMSLDEKAALREHFYPLRKIMAAQPNDWAYHYEKILVESTVRACHEIDSTILRLPMVYGPGDYSRIFPYLKRLEDERPILLGDKKANWRFSRGFVKDMAHAIVLSALDQRPGSKIYNVGEMTAFSELEWIQKIHHAASGNLETICLPDEMLPSHLKEPLAWEQDLVINTKKIREELQYQELSSPEDAVLASVDWIRKHPPTTIDDQLFDYPAEDKAIKRFNV